MSYALFMGRKLILVAQLEDYSALQDSLMQRQQYLSQMTMSDTMMAATVRGGLDHGKPNEQAIQARLQYAQEIAKFITMQLEQIKSKIAAAEKQLEGIEKALDGSIKRTFSYSGQG